jgi:beta-lactamase regulating signal transducer with metallopeptidase domain
MPDPRPARLIESWAREGLRNVLLHELAHVQRRDCLTQTLARVACALYWFNPLVWLAARRISIEHERACDDVVIGAGARPSDNVRHLLEPTRGLRPEGAWAFAAVAMARPSQMEGRLLAILNPSQNRGRLDRLTGAFALAVLAGVIIPLATARSPTTTAASRFPT